MAHAVSRMQKCRRAYYSLQDVGMKYPGCSSDVKAYLWNSICQPVLLYGSDSYNMSAKVLKDLESTQSTLVKNCLGLSKRSKSSHLLQALCIKSVKDKVKHSAASLLKRIFSVDSPVKDLNMYFLSLYICKGVLIPGTLIYRIRNFGMSPTHCVFNVYKKPPFIQGCGIVDSLRHLVTHENFIKPYSEHHILTCLLTKAF